jgi:hypothetical protein
VSSQHGGAGAVAVADQHHQPSHHKQPAAEIDWRLIEAATAGDQTANTTPDTG